ncbi:glycosyltransferase family 4 protein [Roseomonas sp. CAU 1739]|uniref:glycosyltransferase family 4 protein n=1 Tax=Roseomonas sp. CAU 1739 TaxID=3140364 RepID=UPI00325B63C2
MHLDAMVEALRDAGHDVLVVGPPAYEQASLGGESRGLSVLRRWIPAALMEIAELAYGVPAYRRLSRAVRAFRPDAIYERYNLFHQAGALIARRHGLPLLVEVNAPLAEERARFGGLKLRRLARRAEAHVWRAADRVLPVTEVLAGHVAAAGVDPRRIVVVPNGIDLADFPETPAPSGAPPAEIVLGFVGFVRPWHGLDALIRAIAAWQQHPRMSLVVVGEGPAREGLERLAAELGIADRVRFTGLAAREAVPNLIAGFDIALQPAAVPYASPLKVFEYMAAARPIVAPDQPNLREVLQDGQTALLFDPAREGALWDAVVSLATDPALRARIGAAARAEILARDLTWQGNARRVTALIETVRLERAAGGEPVSAPFPAR